MKVNYKLNAEDYLKFQLYTASRSKQMKAKRMVARIIWPIVFLAIGIYFAVEKVWAGAFILAAFAILWFFVYPIYTRIFIKKQFLKEIKEKYAENLDKQLGIEILVNDLQLTAPQGQRTIKFTSISEINDLGSHYLIIFDIGTVAILPIGREVGRNVWDDFIKQLALKSGKSVYDKKDWKWI
jgi:ABC-type protease/lipase transport system fused ATPase/permease subunit